MEFIDLLKRESKSLDRRVFIAGALSGIINTLLIFVLTRAANRIALGRTAYIELAMAAVSLVGYWISKGYMLNRTTAAVEEIIRNIRIRLATKIRDTDLRSFEKIDRASLYNAISSHTMTISRGATTLVSAATALVLLACAFLVIYLQSGTAFLILMAALAVVLFVLFRNRKRILDVLKEVTVQDNVFVGRYVDLLDGFKEVKMNSARTREFFTDDLEPAAEKARQLRVKGTQIVNHSVLVASSALFVLLAAVVFLLPVFSPLDAPKLVGIATLIVFIVGPMSEAVFAFSALNDVNASIAEIKRIEQELDSAYERTGSDTVLSNAPAIPLKRIHCEGLAFQYGTEKGETAFSLEPFDFELHPGEIVFITGGNGSGKSTFLKVLAGLYPPDKGSIFLNEEVVGGSLRQSYRDLFSPVFTDFHLFETLYGIPSPDEARVNALLYQTELLHKTSIEGRRIQNRSLSTGQRKRLALLVALLESKPILLLDEWAAEQDPMFRKKFYREILPQLRASGQTVIAVTHDDDHYDVADRVLRMHYGKFVPLTHSA